MKQSAPRCPYCGSEMSYECTYESGLSYSCKNCWSESPFIKYKGGEDTKALCYEAAMRRPLQKPLTLEELKALIDPGDEVVTYCEGISFCQTYATIWIDGQVIDALGLHPKENISFYSYGKTWRAWATRPTDEERAAAPWEE